MEIKKILKKRKPDVRFLYDMKEVLYDRKWAKKASNLELYYMYRGIKKKNGLSRQGAFSGAGQNTF